MTKEQLEQELNYLDSLPWLDGEQSCRKFQIYRELSDLTLIRLLDKVIDRETKINNFITDIKKIA
jgi:hypothetical protein